MLHALALFALFFVYCPFQGLFKALVVLCSFLWVCGVMVVLVQYFSFLLYFVRGEMTSELFRLKGTCYFLCISLWNFLFLPLPAPGEIVLWLRICKADIPPPFPVLKKYLFFCQSETVKWGLRVFVTKLYILFQFPLAGSQWAKDNSYIQNCLCHRLFLT